ncbi:MAG TPA: hypothetical protein VFF06_34125 [Polyangia bacterium]|nr:hypothetical protein [Polyangia bacterium]
MRHARLLSLLAIAAAGCSGSGLNPNIDQGVGDLAGRDFSTTGGPDLATTPPTNTGTKLVGGMVDFMAGVTSDDRVVYFQGATLAAIPLAGGTPKTIDSDSQFATVSGKTVLSFSNADMVTNQVKLTSWNTTTATPTLITSNSGFVGAVSADGSKIVYMDNVNATGTLGDIFLANADGTGAVSLVAAVTTDAMGGGCAPQVAFTPTRVLVAHCPDPGDAGTSVGTLSSYLIAGGGAVDVATNLQSVSSGNMFSIDSAGATMIVFDVNSNIVLAAPDGTGTQPILDGPVLNAYVLKDGSAAIYVTAANELKRVPLTGAMTPVLLGPTSVTDFAPNPLGSFRSPDDKYVIWFNMAGSVQGVNDLFLSSTATPGTELTLDSMADGFLFGDAFTTDSKRAIFCSATDQNLSGTLQSQPLPTGTQATHSTAVWEVHATTASNIVYSDNFTTTMVGMTTIQRGDLRAVDSSGTAAAKLIATQADVGELLSSGRDKVVYIWKQTAGSEGLFVATATP